MIRAMAATAILATLVHVPLQAADKVQLIGHYSSMVMSHSEDPHYESGYDLDLYRQGARVFGSIAVANGSIELPSARLRDVVFDAATKRLSFTATYSDGWESIPGARSRDRKTRKVLTFSGTATPRAVVGQLAIRDGYCANCKPGTQRVSIKRTNETDIPDDAGADR